MSLCLSCGLVVDVFLCAMKLVYTGMEMGSSRTGSFPYPAFEIWASMSVIFIT